MATLLSSLGIATVVFAVAWFLRRTKSPPQARPLLEVPTNSVTASKLAKALPHIVLLHRDEDAFRKSINTYWVQQEREVMQACIVQPRDVGELAKAIVILKREYDERRTLPRKESDDVLFAVRGGGQSPVPGGASARGGVLIDLSLFQEVTVSDDRESVALGAGVRWAEASRILDEKGLGVVGGRSSDVGVAGYTLGGGISFFTPRFSLACSNVLAYEVVLASGKIVTATALSHPDLWRALKGGSNNFGIVTRFTVRCFPSTQIWSGFMYAPISQSTKALMALHESAKHADPKICGAAVDTHATAPIACFTYIQGLGMQTVTVHLAYTKPPEEPKKWPVYWKNSGFATLWRFWSTFKVHTVTSAVIEMSGTCPPGKRWSFGTTTIKNDLPTMLAARAAHEEAITSLRKVKGLIWTIAMQPFLPSWAAKGDANVLGIHEETDDALLILSFSVYWRRAGDDKDVYASIRKTIEKIDAFATANGTDHPFRYLNYCAQWQRPLEGYGEENLLFLTEVSRKYDPDGLFQRGCTGGFKLHPQI
ncbi:bifunctional solanapyrone synthase [Aspergillus lentulus]|uniref:bifunctional solanapyrone synthase n=1 Tax=Aspergillus lentulus TaxID=293939 RepID=UPI00139357D4|nr:bifunctional solanapyrone synthase [Aspergillus lentulus]GFF55793.1 bifunctional solanapyrone synthase [Aspergillus lentulus]